MIVPSHISSKKRNIFQYVSKLNNDVTNIIYFTYLNIKTLNRTIKLISIWNSKFPYS